MTIDIDDRSLNAPRRGERTSVHSDSGGAMLNVRPQPVTASGIACDRKPTRVGSEAVYERCSSDLGFRTVAIGPPHLVRARRILAAHPEVRTLFGRNPATAAILALVFALQVAIARMMGGLGLEHWWIAIITAYAIGAFANHSLYVVIHEASHNLIFSSRRLNKLAAIASDLPNVVPGAIGFAIYHLKHHGHLNHLQRDPDVASEWEARLVGNRWYAKAIWLALFPFVQLTRVVRLTPHILVNRWVFTNAVALMAFDLAIVAWCGWNGLLYLFASMMFSVGLHPLGARWIQEHYTIDHDQPTFSYYGPLNRLALNIGYHNEHHDFPAIPWNRLPRLRAMAPEFYESLTTRGSWSRLLLEFIFDKRFTLYARVARTDPLPGG